MPARSTPSSPTLASLAAGRPGPLPSAGTAAALLAITLAAAWQGWLLWGALRHGRRLARATQAFEVTVPRPRARILLLGDSTGVGVGAGEPRRSLAGLLAEALQPVAITNVARAGARVGNAADQLAALPPPGERFDLAVLLLGGNDVLRFTPLGRLRREARTLLCSLAPRARRIVWLGCADIGRSPALLPPLSWLMSRRTRRAMRVLAEETRRAGAAFVDFIDFEDRPAEASLAAPPQPQPQHPRPTALTFAPDGVHPSAQSYLAAFEALMRQPALAAANRLRSPGLRSTAPPAAARQRLR